MNGATTSTSAYCVVHPVVGMLLRVNGSSRATSQTRNESCCAETFKRASAKFSTTSTTRLCHERRPGVRGNAGFHHRAYPRTRSPADAAEDQAVACKYEAARLISEELERRQGGARKLAKEIGKSIRTFCGWNESIEGTGPRSTFVRSRLDVPPLLRHPHPDPRIPTHPETNLEIDPSSFFDNRSSPCLSLLTVLGPKTTRSLGNGANERFRKNSRRSSAWTTRRRTYRRLIRSSRSSTSR